MIEPHYTVQQVAEALNVHERTLHRARHHGELRMQKIGKNWRISASALREYLTHTASESTADFALSRLGEKSGN